MEEINIKTLLPVGEKLKPLLSKSCISESDLKGILSSSPEQPIVNLQSDQSLFFKQPASSHAMI